MIDKIKYPSINPSIGKDGKEYATREALEKADAEYYETQKVVQAAESVIPAKADPERVAYERMMNVGYQAAEPKHKR